MKRVLILMMWLMSVGCVSAFEVTFDQTPVWGTIGDSYMNDKPPLNSAFGGTPLAGGSNGDISKALVQIGKRVHTTAQAGATSFDQYDANGIVWYGLEKQLDQLLAQTVWFDGIDRLETVLIGPMMNDCSHTRVCTAEDMDTYIGISASVANRAVATGKKVVVIAPPEYDTLHLEEAVAFYDIPVYADRDTYNMWRDKHIAALSNVYGVRYVYAYDKMESIDGLHPTWFSYFKAALSSVIGAK